MGDKAAVAEVSRTRYEDLYRAHYPRIVRLCRLLLRDVGEAEEVAQEVFVKLLRVSSGLSQSLAWEAWLTRVAVNACRDRQRNWWWRRRREDTMDWQELQLPSLAPTPEETTLSREQRERIWQSLRHLSARQREIFVLRYVEGWSGDEVADLLGVTSGSVKRHLFRAVQLMRQALGGSL
ncbi:MAG: RNA polymerase sigma factor [Candidatus Binatia bacterium]